MRLAPLSPKESMSALSILLVALALALPLPNDNGLIRWKCVEGGGGLCVSSACAPPPTTLRPSPHTHSYSLRRLRHYKAELSLMSAPAHRLSSLPSHNHNGHTPDARRSRLAAFLL